jgi:hypothetical protein
VALPVPRAFWPLTITAANDTFAFLLGVTPYTASLSVGTVYYDPATYASAVAAAMTAQVANAWVGNVSATGRVTISGTSAWRPTARDGWAAAGYVSLPPANATSQTGDVQHQNGWYGIDPVLSDTKDLPQYDRRQSVSKSGRVRGLEIAKRKTRLVELAFLPGRKVYVADEGATTNEAIERLFDSGWARFRWWPDGLVAGIYADYALDVETAKELPYRRLNAANALYSLALRMRSYV